LQNYLKIYLYARKTTFLYSDINEVNAHGHATDVTKQMFKIERICINR